MFENDKDRSQADRAYQTIKKDILTCKLDPGSPMAQSQLVERYELGLTPVREALKRLENEGYVRSIPRFGYIISPITVRDIEEIYDVRLILETSAVRLAIQRAGDEQLRQIQEQANFTYTFNDRESYLQFLEHNNSFHVAIALAAGNRKLAEMLQGVLNEMIRIFSLGLGLKDSAEEMRNEHMVLTDALVGREMERAVQITTEQIARSRQRVMEEVNRRINQREQRGLLEMEFPNGFFEQTSD